MTHYFLFFFKSWTRSFLVFLGSVRYRYHDCICGEVLHEIQKNLVIERLDRVYSDRAL